MVTGPHSPKIDVTSLLYGSSYTQPYLSITLTTGQPLWPGYTISAFLLSIINVSSRVVLREINFTVDPETKEIQLNQSLPESLIYDCSTLLITVSAYSVSYGASKLSVTDVSIPKCKSLLIKLNSNYMC